MSNEIGRFGNEEDPWLIPDIDQGRQAIASMRGYIYQIHLSAAAWINLKDGDFLHLEVAEDFSELLKDPNNVEEILKATQVKDTRESGSVTLNSKDVLGAIESLFRLQKENPGRDVRLIYLTTSSVGKEKKKPLPSGNRGLDAWDTAAKSGEVDEIRTALLDRLDDGPLRAFVETSAGEVFRQRILSALTFVCGAGDWKAIESKSRLDLVALHEKVQATAGMAERAYDAVLAEVMHTLLSSPLRQLDRSRLLACLKMATSVAIPSQVAADLFSAGALSAVKAPVRLELVALHSLASTLLKIGEPASIATFFPDAPLSALSALKATAASDRSVVRMAVDVNASLQRISINDLASMPSQRSLVVGPPGSGKSHALWKMADRLMREGELVPIFLPVGGLSSWKQVTEVVSDCCPGVDPASVLTDSRVCVFLDGWTEFAAGNALGERGKALRVLSGVRVIASARHADGVGGAFEVWELDLLSPQVVTSTIENSSLGQRIPPTYLLDLLKIPLLLSLYVLSTGKAVSAGALLRQFHENLAREFPESFSEILSGAVAAMCIAGEKSYGRLIAEIQSRARRQGISDSKNLLERLGTIVNRSGQSIPVHDLYWSWLCGCGLLYEARTGEAIGLLGTRESLTLAFQSGLSASTASIDDAVDKDLVLAAEFDASVGAAILRPSLSVALEARLQDPRLAVRSRAALACLQSGRPQYFRRALDVFSELVSARLIRKDWLERWQAKDLFALRGMLSDWLGQPGSDLLIDAIADTGGPEWVPWLEQMVVAGKVKPAAALAAALACEPGIPSWGHIYLDDLFRDLPWALRSVSKRKLNLPLAHRIASDYERLIATVVPQGSSAWIDVNSILVSCGNDDCFKLLLNQFEKMGPRSQELLGFAVVDRGGMWVPLFQKIAFSSPGGKHHHKLEAVVSLDIDDATARQWISSGYEEIGWRVLIRRHGEALLPELIAGLPSTFDGIHHIERLACMQYLDSAPTMLIDELLRRIQGAMQPKAMQDVLYALAKVEPEGVVSIVRFMGVKPGVLPAYHVAIALRLYKEWKRKFGLELMIQAGAVELPFPRWAATVSVQKGWERGSTSRVLAEVPDLAIEMALGVFRNDHEKLEEILGSIKGLSTYNDDLFNVMIAVPRLAKLVPNLFMDAWDNFPSASLMSAIESPDIDQDLLMFRLSAGSNPIHKDVHRALIERVLGSPINMSNLQYVARMLRGYTRHEVLGLLTATGYEQTEGYVWLLRSVSVERAELLVNDNGALF